MPEVPSPHNQEALDELCRLLRFSQGEFALILAVCNSTQHRQALVDELQQQCPIPFDEITLSPTASTLFTTVNTYINEAATTSPEALMVYGLNEVEDPEQLLTATNQIREEFRGFTFPLVLWLTDNDQKHLIRTAPDFYTWANPITFETPSSFYLSFVDGLIDHVWQQVTQSQENRFLTTQELGLTETSANYRELETSLAALAQQAITLPIHQAADLEFVRGRIANNNSTDAREHYEYSLEKWKTLVTGEDDNPRWQEKMGHVQFYLGLWWRNHAERHRPDFELAFGEARAYFAATIETLEGVEEDTASAETLSRGQTLAARYINYLAESLHRLERWAELAAVATRAKALHQRLNNPFRVARAEGFLAEVALAREDWATAQQHAETALEFIQSDEIIEKSKQNADFYNWINSFHRAWYLFSLGKAQFRQGGINAAVQTLEKARSIAQPDYDPKLYSLILEQLQRCYFEQGLYLPAFETRRQRDAIESRFNYRAFVGAGRLQPKQQIANPALPTEENRKDAIVASGRKHDVQKLVQRLAQDEYVLTIVYGPSGVGKSSLIEAGLVPALEQERIETRRVVPVYLRRYRNWVEDLVQLLTDLDAGLSAYRSDIFSYPQDLLDGESDTALNDTALPEKVLRRLKHHTQKNQTMVLVFDQFEEFFFEFEQTAERRAFYDFLGTCLGMPYVKVILSLREDYIHYLLECARLTNLDIVDNNILDKKWLYYLGNFSLDDTKAVFHDLTYPTPYTPEQELIEKVVSDLAAGAGEVRPIELQIIGAQLQAEGITTPEIYYNWGDPELPTKELLVQKYLNDIVDECGPQEHQDLAEMVLYLLTDEKGTRPLKTESDLAGDLQTMTNRAGLDRDLLSLILKILTESGLVTEVPEVPEERYQLVHDYLANFIRSLQQPFSAQLEEEQRKRLNAEKKQTEEQRKRLNAEKKQKRQAYRALSGAVIALIAIVVGVIFWQQKRLATQEKIKTELLLSNLSIKSNLDSGFEKDAVLEAIKLGQKSKTFLPYPQEHFRILSGMQQVLYNLREKERLIGHSARVLGVTFSPDGNTIASASGDNTIKLWSKDGTELNTLKGHSTRVWDIAFSPDGNTIASASGDNTIKLWSKDGTELNTLKGHNDSVFSVTFSSDGNTIASASGDNTIKLWNKDGIELNTLKGHKANVLSVAFSPDGNTIASASADNTIKLWNKDGTVLNTIKGHNDWVWDVAFSPNGNTIASASADNTVKLWKKDGTALNILKGHNNRVLSVAFSLDGNTIASASEDTTIKLWSKDGTELNTLKGHSDSVLSVAFSLDGNTIASASEDTTIKLWSKDGTEVNILKGHKDSVSSVIFSPDGHTIASASNDNTIKLWHKNGMARKTIKGHDDWVWSIAFSPDGNTIASASADNTIRLWSKDGEALGSIEGHSEWVWNVAFSSDGNTIASASDDNTIKLWSRNGTELNTLKGHQSRILSVAFSPDSNTIASASADNSIKLWNWHRSKHSIGSKTLKGHNASVLSVTFSPDGSTIASASADNTIKLWSKDGTELNTLKGHNASVLSVTFSPDGSTIASASADNTIKLWNLQLDDLMARGCNWLSSYFVKQSPDLLIDLEACQQYNPDWIKEAAPLLIVKTDNYLVKDDRLEPKKSKELALYWYQTVKEWNNNFVFSPEDRLQTIESFKEAIQSIKVKDIQPTIEKFQSVQLLEPTLQQNIWEVENSWGKLCRQGSLHGDAQSVLFACEEAAKRAPFRTSSVDNRGLAYALTGNTKEAIADFKIFINRTTDKNKKSKRQEWIDALEKGENPFTPEVLESLRKENDINGLIELFQK